MIERLFEMRYNDKRVVFEHTMERRVGKLLTKMSSSWGKA